MRNKPNNILYCMALAAMLPLMAACSQDDNDGQDSATVTLSFTTRANAPAAPLADGEEGPANANESMKNLRIIMQRVDGGRNEIQFNYFREFTPEDLTTSTQVTFEGIPAGTYNFYAIANETTDYSNITADGLQTMLDQTLDASVLSAINGGTQAIPAACTLANVTVSEGTNQNLTMELIRAVAKLRVRIINETGEEQSVSGMAWNNCCAATTPLFPATAVSAALATGTVALPTPAAVPAADGSNTWECSHYVYEGTCASALTFSAEWPAGTQRTIALKEAGNVLQRNTLLDLIITLEAAPFDMTWTYKVIPWDEVTNEVEFN